jgi:hypothetical protein
MPVRPGIVVRPALLLGALLTVFAGASVVSTATTLSGLGSLGARATADLSTGLSAGAPTGGPSGVPAPVTGTQGTVPPSNPPRNIPPNPNFLYDCSGSTYDNSAGCTNATLQAIANGRAAEGLPGMSLPSNWYSLSATQQLYVATNLERAARGLPILGGMATALDSASTQGAANSADPTPPSGFPWSSWGSNWAGAVGNPLEAIYYWMYDDGMGSNNIDCTPSNSSGCWGHRDNVLMPLNCQPCVMGTGYVGNGYQGYPSWAELLVDTTGNPRLDATWAQLTGAPSSAAAAAPSPTSAPSVAIGPTGLPTEAVQGPGSSVWIYWEAANAQWYGPLGVGEGIGQPSIAISQGSGLPTVAVEGPGNSVWVYWESADAQWHGPYGIGQGFGAPSISIGASGLPTVVTQGPGNSLWVYWEAANAQWYGPLGVGEGVGQSTVSVSPTSGLPTVVTRGPGNALWVYWESADAQWHGPYGIGQGFGSPTISVGGSGLPTISVAGPGNSVWVYWESADAQWHGPYGIGQGFGDPHVSIGPHGSLPTVAVQGPGNSLWVYWEAANAQWYGPLGIGSGGSTNAPPSIAIGPSGLPTVAVMGPGAALVYWEAANAQWYGPLGS